jgi:hypothetical protein
LHHSGYARRFAIAKHALHFSGDYARANLDLSTVGNDSLADYDGTVTGPTCQGGSRLASYSPQGDSQLSNLDHWMQSMLWIYKAWFVFSRRLWARRPGLVNGWQ